MDFITIANYILGTYAIIIEVVGTIGNLFVFALMLRPQLRKVSTFIYFAFILVNDTIALHFWNLKHFTSAFFDGFSLIDDYPAWCKWGTYFQTSSLTTSVWTLVALSIDRCVNVLMLRRKKRFVAKRALVIGTLITVLMYVEHAPMLFSFGYEDENGTFYCFNPNYPQTVTLMDIYFISFSFFVSFVPWCVICLSNAILLYGIRRKKRLRQKQATTSGTAQRPQQSKKGDSLNRTVIIITLLFIVVSLPGGLITSSFATQLEMVEWGEVIFALADCISLSYQAFGFLLLIVTNKRVSDECRAVLFRFSSNIKQ